MVDQLVRHLHLIGVKFGRHLCELKRCSTCRFQAVFFKMAGLMQCFILESAFEELNADMCSNMHKYQRVCVYV